MCGCKHKKGQRKAKRGKRGGHIPLWAKPVPKRRQTKPRKYPVKCIKCSVASAGKYIKGKSTKNKPRMRVKTIGGRRGRKRGAQWIDDDYLANMPVKGGQKKRRKTLF